MLNRFVKTRHLTMMLTFLALASCATPDRYELSKDQEGRLVRLDKQTGEVVLIDTGKLNPVTFAPAADAPTGSELPFVQAPEDSKTWPVLTLTELGNASAELTTYWQEDRLHYILQLYPISKRLKLAQSDYYSGSSFSLRLSDAADNQVAGIELPAKQLARTLNASRHDEQLSIQGDMAMSSEDYAGLANWQLTWRH